MKKRIFGVLFLVLAVAVFAGCKEVAKEEAPKEDTKKKIEYTMAQNDKMDDATKTELKKITTSFEQALNKNDANQISSLLDKDFNVTTAMVGNFFEQVANMKINPFTRYDDYYMKGLKTGESVIQIKKNSDSKDAIELTPGGEELYAVMYVSENKEVSTMISLICSKVEKAWKIVWIDISDMKYDGMDANTLYEKGLKCEKDGKVMPARVYAEMMMNVIQPGKMLKYENFDKMQDFFFKMQSTAFGDKKLPFKIDDAGNILHGVGLAKDGTRIIPMIAYQTVKKGMDDKTR
ncbi:MAG: hypothetical protein RSA70_05840, partial [Clostridia bacterium]